MKKKPGCKCDCCGRDHSLIPEHRCIHGKVISTFHAECRIGWGDRSWKSGGVPYKCPFQWYMGDCSKYKYNPKFVY